MSALTLPRPSLRRSSRRGARGQAVTEAALGMLVFVTVFVFAVYFAESLFLSMKVQEAGTAALWDSTGGYMHIWPGDSAPATSTAQSAGAYAGARYQDFDGRESTNYSVVTVKQTWAEAQMFAVGCDTGAGLGWGGFGTALTTGVYTDKGGVQCTGVGGIAPRAEFPSAFLEDPGGGTGGFFKAAHTTGPMFICSTGRAWGGSCTGRMTMLLDDWGLSGTATLESEVCAMIPDFFGLGALIPCLPNAPYYAMQKIPWFITDLLVMPYHLSASMLYEMVVYRPSPINEDAGWMSAMGEDPTAFLQPVAPSDGPFGIPLPLMLWPTIPGGASITMPWYSDSYGSRDGCFLGQPC